MTKGELLERLSNLEDSDEVVFIHECDSEDSYETELEFRTVVLVSKNRYNETEIWLER